MDLRTSQARGFTLIEIVIALGLFSFAIIGVVFLLGTGLSTSRETQRDSGLASALATSAALLRSGAAPVAAYTNYYDQQGGWQTNASNAFFALTVTPLPSGGTLSTNLTLYSVKAIAPYPGTNSAGNFLMSRAK